MPLIILFSLLIAAIFWLNSPLVYRILYIALNLQVIFIFLVAAEIFTSLFPFVPWHENGGIQPIVVIYLAVWLATCGTVLWALSGRMPVNSRVKYLPFAGAAAFGLAVLLNPAANVVVQILASLVALGMMAIQTTLFAITFKSLFPTAK